MHAHGSELTLRCRDDWYGMVYASCLGPNWKSAAHTSGQYTSKWSKRISNTHTRLLKYILMVTLADRNITTVGLFHRCFWPGWLQTLCYQFKCGPSPVPSRLHWRLTTMANPSSSPQTSVCSTYVCAGDLVAQKWISSVSPPASRHFQTSALFDCFIMFRPQLFWDLCYTRADENLTFPDVAAS